MISFIKNEETCESLHRAVSEKVFQRKNKFGRWK